VIDWLKSQFIEKEQAEDRILVEKAKTGNRDAFGQLYLKYLAGIYRYFYFRMGQNRMQAEDMTEQVFFKAWSALPAYQEKGLKFSSWLYRIAHNLLVDSYRKETEVGKLSESYRFEDKSLEKIVVEEEYVVLHKAINTLTDDQKQIILLKFVEGFNNKEISDITGKQEDSIRALQYRALVKLREILGKENGF